MANEIRLRANNISGAINDNPLIIGATTINSPSFADLPVVDTTNHLIITLDPLEVFGAAETVMVIAHTAASTSVTAIRGQEGSTARQHPLATTWFHGPVGSDWNYTQRTALSTNRPTSPFNGELIYETNTNRWVARSSGGAWLPAPNNPPTVSLRRDASFNLTNAANTTISWDIEEWDTDNMWVIGSPTRITINTPGIYVVTANALITSNATGLRELNFLVNGAVVGAVNANNAVNGTNHGATLSRTWKLGIGDFLETRIFQNSGGTLTIVASGGHWWTNFSATWIGVG